MFDIKEGDVYQNECYTVIIGEIGHNYIKYMWCGGDGIDEYGEMKDNYKWYDGLSSHQSMRSFFVNASGEGYRKVEEKMKMVKVFLDDNLFEVD